MLLKRTLIAAVFCLLMPEFLAQQIPPPARSFSKRSLAAVTLASQLAPDQLTDCEVISTSVAGKAGEVVVEAECAGDTLSGEVRNIMNWATPGTKLYFDIRYRKAGQSYVHVLSLGFGVTDEQ